MNVTLPTVTALPPDVWVTAAVNVTDWPNTDGVCDEVTVVVVGVPMKLIETVRLLLSIVNWQLLFPLAQPELITYPAGTVQTPIVEPVAATAFSVT